MAVRTVQQINQELGSVYNPQIQSIQAQKATIPMGVEADIKQAEAAQTQSFDEIMGGARRRGMGFSGIPLSEQAKYASTVFAPEVLRARQRGKQQELSLADALNSIYERRNNQALALQQQDVANDQWGQTFAFEKEKWAQSLRDQAEARAQAARASSAMYGGLGMGGNSNQNPAQKPQTQLGKYEQQAYDNLRNIAAGAGINLANYNGNLTPEQSKHLLSDYRATKGSAMRGNPMDKAKLVLYYQIFKNINGREATTIPAAALANGNQLSF
jgi:hypothetical protein